MANDLFRPLLDFLLLLLLTGDIEQASFVMKDPAFGIEDGVGIVLSPDHPAVHPLHLKLEIPKDSVLGHEGGRTIPVFGVEIEIAGRPSQDGGPVFETEHVHHGRVEVEDPSLWTCPVKADGNALEKGPVFCLRFLEALLGPLSLQGIDENLPHDLEEGEGPLRPNLFPACRIEPEKSDQGIVQDHRNGDEGFEPKVLKELLFRPGLRRKVLNSLDANILSLTELVHIPGKGLEGNALHFVLYGRDPPGAPFMGVGAMVILKQEDRAMVGACDFAYFFQDFFNPSVEILRRKVDEFCGNRRDQVLELDPGVEGGQG